MLFATDPREKLCVSNRFKIFHMVIEEILSLWEIFCHTEWTSIGFWNVWLFLLVNISSKFFTIIDYLEISTFLIDEHKFR